MLVLIVCKEGKYDRNAYIINLWGCAEIFPETFPDYREIK